MPPLTDRVALVTGASSGIGSASATRLAAAGASVALVGRELDALEATATAVRDAGGNARVLAAELTRADECQRVVAEAAAEWGRLDVLVNAAGIIGGGSVKTTSDGDWNEMMRINLDAVFWMMRAAVPHLKQVGGNVVNVSSVTGLRSFPGILAYCVSKAGVDQLTRCAALELADDGVRVNAVNPGVVVSQLHRRSGMDDAAYRAFLQHSKTTHPLGRVGQPDDIADAILFLASEASGWITGETLSVDGGRHLTCAR